jgi:hypothetical protein
MIKKVIFVAVLLIILMGVFLYFPRLQNFFVNSKKLEYGTCIVEYDNYWFGQEYLWPGHTIPNNMLFYYANRKLALCLCDEYTNNRTAKLAEKIIELTKTYGEGDDYDVIDSIIYHKEVLLNPIMYIE